VGALRQLTTAEGAAGVYSAGKCQVASSAFLLRLRGYGFKGMGCGSHVGGAVSKREFDLRPSTVDNIGKSTAGTAGVRPSKRPVPRVQVEVLICRTPDIRNIGRRCRPQPGPVLRFAWFADAREQFDQAAYDRPAANQIEFEIEPVKAWPCRRRAADLPAAKTPACIRHPSS
jgi:hypothetical protein